jgi:hypothetical protein
LRASLAISGLRWRFQDLDDDFEHLEDDLRASMVISGSRWRFEDLDGDFRISMTILSTSKTI